MTFAWLNYQTDTGFNYPFVPLNVFQISDISSEDSPLLLLPIDDVKNATQIDSFCNVPGLTYRKIKLFLSDESVYEINYYKPFSENLFDWLSSSIKVRAFELTGETIKYSRLRKMLDRGQ